MSKNLFGANFLHFLSNIKYNEGQKFNNIRFLIIIKSLTQMKALLILIILFYCFVLISAPPGSLKGSKCLKRFYFKGFLA